MVLAGHDARPSPGRSPRDLSALQPAHAAYFQARLRQFDRLAAALADAIAQFKAAYPGTPVATTEPVGDYMLQAAGRRT